MNKDKACISAVKEVCQRCHLYKENCGMLDFPDQCSISGRYIDGYHQAEKDLLENKREKSWRLDEKLWKGIKDIEEASYQYMYDASNDWAYDIPTWKDVQDAFKAGSEWKEDLELSWKDIREICKQSVLVEVDLGRLVSDERHYTKVLERFKERKEKK